VYLFDKNIHEAVASITARCISAAVRTRTTATTGGMATEVGPVTSVTSAPRAARSPAIAMPIFPLERLPMKRTGSNDSCVGPAVTTIRRPVSDRGRDKTRSAASTTASGSASRPLPIQPHAR
jgi:hypothetical protein